MGRTAPTYRDRLRHLEEDWSPYRDALRRDDQEAFDRLFTYAQQHAAAAGYQNTVDPFETTVMSMLLGVEKERRALAERVEELEAQLAEHEARAGAR